MSKNSLNFNKFLTRIQIRQLIELNFLNNSYKMKEEKAWLMSINADNLKKLLMKKFIF